MFCSELILLIIICLVLGLLPISSDFFRLGGHLKRLFQSCIRSGVAWPILLSTAGELLPHLCTIACEFTFHRQSFRGITPLSVVRSTGSHRPEFLRRPVLGCTDFPHRIINYPARLSGCFILVTYYNTN